MTNKYELHELKRITIKYQLHEFPSTASRSGTILRLSSGADYSQSSVSTLQVGTPFSIKTFLNILIIAGGPEIK